MAVEIERAPLPNVRQPDDYRIEVIDRSGK
jgi:hypothetical protein